ncbi:MAG: DUF4827 domain-containing protein [Prevotella sp.]|nr:DUF4827 domain-containing protein [Prevotella sp.]MCM1074666.1 DUF4827 domain-containing protein [Ruminococcus sp.]
MKKFKISSLFTLIAILAATASCSKTKSYSELLRTEEKVVNWYMAQHKIETEVPEDSVFEYGPDAPFYRMDEDGYVYMQVLNPGNKNNKAKKDQLIYFRYMRTNIEDMYDGLNPQPTGNANNVGTDNATCFRFDNTELPSSIAYGSGLQVPLKYLGLDCEVNIVIRSYYGVQAEMGACQAYIYNVRYFPAQF